MVTLHGGELGGEFVPADDWPNGTEKEFAGLIYRREGNVGIYCGVAA